MAKVQLNLYVEESIRDAIMELAHTSGCRGPSDLVVRKVMAFADGDLNCILEGLTHALTRGTRRVDMSTLKAVRDLADAFLVSET